MQASISLVDRQSLFSMKITVAQRNRDQENGAHPSKSNPFTKPRGCTQRSKTDQLGYVSPKKHVMLLSP